MTEVLDWLYLKQEKERLELEKEAALHGVKLKDRSRSPGGLRSLARDLGMAMPVVKISPEEYARRQELRRAGKRIDISVNQK